ncbi:MAG: D-glycero-alpha-D-manno-heptose-1,7-bisphosphate 7-phosphatase [Endomicrobiales bacterium]
MARAGAKSPAVFIDRDGTLIRERNYLSKIKDVALLSGAPEALRLLKQAGFKLVLVTNQSGIGRGYFSEEAMHRVHRHLQKLLAKKGARLDGIYYCPHGPETGCSCRKPALGMVKKARRELNLDLKNSFTVGDHRGDFLLGRNMGGKGIFVLTGHGRREIEKIRREESGPAPDRVERNLCRAAKWIVRTAAAKARVSVQLK